jgi:formate dehydrogenase maturation protein FdhE
MRLAAFERRASRAEALAGGSPAAAEMLRFAAGLYRVQGRMAADLHRAHASQPWSGRLEEDGPRLVPSAAGLLAYAAEQGPPALADQARAHAADDPGAAVSRWLAWWNGDQPTSEGYLSRALLRPYVELLAGLAISPARLHRRHHCPFCGGAPWIAWRRSEVSEAGAEAAQRRLGCGLCGGDWAVNRILCPSCDEADPLKLPVFQSETYASVRIEACETCRRYVKSIDLTQDARPIPEVDDLVSLAMDLWAAEQGFTRIEPGQAGI